MMRLKHRRLSGVAWSCVILCATACVAREKATVTVSYVVAPATPLPEGLHAVAVIDSGVRTEGAHQDAREQKWSAMAGDMIEAMLQHASAQYGANLAVAKRSQTRRILEEQDLRLAGLVAADDAAKAGRLLAVQGLVTSRIVINLDVQRARKSSIDWVSIFGGVVSGLSDRDRREPREVRPAPVVVRRAPADPRVRDPRDPRSRPRYYLYSPAYRPTRSPRPAGPPPGGGAGITLKTREVEEISRSLTVQCSFSLIDATTGRALVQHSPPPYQKTDSASPDFLFGGMVNEADLDPVDHFIGELVERATQEFVGMLVPVRVEKTYELELSGKRGEAAIRALRADDFDAALAQLAPLAGGKDDDEGDFSFAAGVVCELRGEYDKALAFYRQAAAAPDTDAKKLPRYLEAKQRLTQHIGRMLRPSSIRPPTEPPDAAAPGESPPPREPPESAPAPSSPPPPPPREAPVRPPQTAPASVEEEIRILKELEEKAKNR